MADDRTTVDDRVWRQLRERVRGIDRARVKVGIVGPAADSETGEGGITLGELAAIHELGAPAAGIPARSFIRRTFDLKSDELRAMQVKIARLLIKGSVTAQQAMGLLGAWGAAAIKATITQGKVIPRLQDSPAGLRTIARKGSSQTLVDTGQLVNSVTWEVENT